MPHNKQIHKLVKLHAHDNVAIASGDIAQGELCEGQLEAKNSVSFGHKIALSNICRHESILKYGQVIGIASKDIEAGEHVHVHNMQSIERNTKVKQFEMEVTAPSQFVRTFEGYLRESGKAGTRNYVGVMATVNCSATVVSKIVRNVEQDLLVKDHALDAVIPIVHQSGCGIPASTGSELSLLQALLSAYINHPNFFGWIIVGLGCEVNQIDSLLESAGRQDDPKIRTVGIQESGGTLGAIEKGTLATRELMSQAIQCHRQTLPAKLLTLGLQCGGSDAWSGITANPALGVASDLVVEHGGTSILAETPEIYGAEQLLYQRSISAKVSEALANKVQWWERYLHRHSTDLNNNPSPGNLAGGISTILEKSLGAVAKGGQSPLVQVLNYAEPSQINGFSFMDSPGFDPCSVTGQIASGANIVCFTTGRGSTFGAAGAPCLKLASNQAIYERMQDDMDIDCSVTLRNQQSLQQLGGSIFEHILEVASGTYTKSEQLGLGSYEFVPWHKGAIV